MTHLWLVMHILCWQKLNHLPGPTKPAAWLSASASSPHFTVAMPLHTLSSFGKYNHAVVLFKLHDQIL